MGFQVREDGGPRRAVGRDVLGGVSAAEQRGDGRLENIKPVDPLLYSQLTHQKNIGFMKRKMQFNPGQF